MVDAKSNNLRGRTVYRDELQRITKQYEPSRAERSSTLNKKEDEIDDIIARGDLDSFLEAWDNELLQAQNVIPVDNDEQRVPTVFGLQTIKEKGAFRCGYECLANLLRQERENFDNFCETQSRNTEPNVEQPVQPETSFNNVPPKQDE